MNKDIDEATEAVDKINKRISNIINKFDEGHKDVDWLSLKPEFILKIEDNDFYIDFIIPIFNEKDIVKTVYSSKNENRSYTISQVGLKYYQPFESYLIDEIINKDKDLYFKFSYYYDDIEFVNINNLQKLFNKEIIKYTKSIFIENHF